MMGVEQLAQVSLGGLRLLGLGLEDLLGLRLLGQGPAGAAQVGVPLHPHPEGGLVVLGQTGLDCCVDLAGIRRRLRRGLRDQQAGDGHDPGEDRA
ncbi:hypothetical protein ACFQ0B_57865 [Nonomuraea thailandensis]